MLTELRNPSPAIAALLEEKRVVGHLPPASEGRLFRFCYIRMLHKRNNQLIQKNAAVTVQKEILRCKLSEDGNNGHRVDFQAVTIKNLRSQINKQKTQSEVDIKTLMNLQRLLHTHTSGRAVRSCLKCMGCLSRSIFFLRDSMPAPRPLQALALCLQCLLHQFPFVCSRRRAWPCESEFDYATCDTSVCAMLRRLFALIR